MDKIFQWKNDFTVGNFKLDGQHKILLNLAKEIDDIAIKIKESGFNPNFLPTIQSTLKEIIALSKTHFKDEEEFMQDINFPFYKQHVESHKILKDKLKEIIKNIGNIDLFIEGFSRFLNEWIVLHFAIEDKLLDAYLNRAVYVKENHFNLESYIQLKSILKRDINKEQKFDYICSCYLKKYEIPHSIHKEFLEQNRNVKCQTCKQFLTYLDEIYISDFKSLFLNITKNAM